MTFGRLIKQEWIKLQSRRSLIFVIVCILLNAGFSFLSFAIVDLNKDVKMTADMMATLNPFAILLGGFSGFLAVIASLFFIMQYGDEYKFGLIRKNIIDGMDRKDIFNGKMLFLFGSYFIWTILLILTFLICGAIKFGGDFGMLVSSIQPEQIVKYYLHVIMFGALSFFLVSVTRSSTSSILILFGIYIVDIIAKQVFPMLHWEKVTPYLPTELATTIRASDIISTPQQIAFLVYVFVLIVVGQLAIYKRDL